MIVTNASERTQYFHFPIFTQNDKPSWTVDWNNTFEELDGILETIKIKINSMETKDNHLEADMEQLNAKMLELQSIVTDYTYFFNDMKKEFKELKDNQITLAAAVKELVDANLDGKILTLQGEINGLDERVTALENQ